MSYLGTTKIGKMYLGSTEIAKAYLGNTLVFQKGGGSTTVPYIRGGGSGGSYIDTGITADDTVRIVVWARNWNPGSGYLFGSREAAAQNTFCIAANSLSSGSVHVGGINIAYGNSNSNYADNQFENLSGYHKYELYQGVLKIDDVLVASATTATFSNSLNIHVIGLNGNGTHSSSAYPIDICKVAIWKNGVAVRYMTPVESPSVGLYDSISDTVFTNAGSGSFTYDTFDLSGYTPLQYVECVNASYIDTGIYGSNSTHIITKIRPGGESAAYRWLLGARTSSSSKILEFELGTDSVLNKNYYMNFGSSTLNVVYSTESQTGNDLVWTKYNNTSKLYKNHSQLGTVTANAETFTTDYTMAIGGRNNAGTIGNGFRGRIYYVGFGADGSFVPMLHNGEAGLYDMYSDTFYPSISENEFVAGPSARIVSTNHFRGKKLTIIGDSICTYDQAGYKYDSYSMYYPHGDVTNVNFTWWKRLMNDEGATLEVNLSYSGSCACTRQNYPSLYTRVSHMGNPDIVIIALGTNDSAQSKPLGDYSYDLSIAELDESSFRSAYIKGIKAILAAKPSVEIVCAIFSMGDEYRNSIKAIAEHYGFIYVDCGNNYTKEAGVHPSVYGMYEIESRFLLAQ